MCKCNCCYRTFEYANKLWEDLETIDEFLICFPLKAGAIAIAVFGIIYGALGFGFFVAMLVQYNAYQKVYANKQDLLVYLIIFTGMMGEFFFTGILLMWGVLGEHETLVLVFLWSALAHILLNVLVTLGIIVYCSFVNSTCFQGSGFGMILSSLIIGSLYSFFWGYIIIAVNSYRSSMY